jgi:hypothetical protein
MYLTYENDGNVIKCTNMITLDLSVDVYNKIEKDFIKDDDIFKNEALRHHLIFHRMLQKAVNDLICSYKGE